MRTTLIEMDNSSQKTGCFTNTTSAIISKDEKEYKALRTALAIHLACTNGASTEDIDAILLKNPATSTHELPEIEVSSESEDLSSQKSEYGSCCEEKEQEDPLQFDNYKQQLIKMDIHCRSICPSKFNTTSVCRLNSEGELDNTFSAFLPALETAHENGNKFKTIPLTSDALSRKHDFENILIRKREQLWAKHSRTFEKLRAEINEIVEERNLIWNEFKKSEDELSSLSRKYVTANEKNINSSDDIGNKKKSIVTRIRLKLPRKKIEAGDVDAYDMGMASVNGNDIKRYYYELEERHTKLKKKYDSLNRSIFGRIDKQIERTLCVRLDGSNSKCS